MEYKKKLIDVCSTVAVGISIGILYALIDKSESFTTVDQCINEIQKEINDLESYIDNKESL
jgi:hypothetical protein